MGVIELRPTTTGERTANQRHGWDGGGEGVGVIPKLRTTMFSRVQS